MSCPSRRRLAAAASGEDVAAELHAESCARCRAELEAMVALIGLARRAPTRALSEDRRTTIGIAVLAEADADAALASPARQATRRTWIVAAAIVSTLGAAAAATIRWQAPPARSAPRPSAGSDAAPTGPRGSRTHAAGAPVAPPPAPPVDTQAPTAPPPVVTPAPAAPAAVTAAPTAAGPATASLDGAAPATARTAPVPAPSVAPPRRAPAIVAPPPAPPAAGVQPRAEPGDAQPHAGPGSDAQRTEPSDDAQRAEPGDEARPVAEPAAMRSMHAFEQGWVALRDRRYRVAVAAFDRARDPVIAEDAAYWAAIASARAGDAGDATRRLREFISRFPGSLRIDEARRALASYMP